MRRKRVSQCRCAHVTQHGCAQVKSVVIGGLSAVVLPPQAGLVFIQVATAPTRRALTPLELVHPR